MDITRLRILTLKSKAFFYSDPNWTIEKLINDKPFMVLRTYYEQEKISFNQEVLEILQDKYPNFIEIDKPSKFPYWKDILFGDIKNKYNEMSYQEILKLIKWYKTKKIPLNKSLQDALSNTKQKHKREVDNINLIVSKKDLQGKNHGR